MSKSAKVVLDPLPNFRTICTGPAHLSLDLRAAAQHPANALTDQARFQFSDGHVAVEQGQEKSRVPCQPAQRRDDELSALVPFAVRKRLGELWPVATPPAFDLSKRSDELPTPPSRKSWTFCFCASSPSPETPCLSGAGAVVRGISALVRCHGPPVAGHCLPNG